MFIRMDKRGKEEGRKGRGKGGERREKEGREKEKKGKREKGIEIRKTKERARYSNEEKKAK